LRRAQKKCYDVEVKEINYYPTTQDRFLSNTNNKCQFIDLISKFLKDDNQNVINCSGDADTTIVKTAINQAVIFSKPVVLVADDTDIAIMLLYHWKDNMADIIFYPERLQKGWSMKSITPGLTTIKDHLLFIHAWSGCDTVSAPWKGEGKFSAIMFKIRRIERYLNLNDRCMGSCKRYWLFRKGCVFRIMYHGKKEDTLTKLRYTRSVSLWHFFRLKGFCVIKYYI